MLMLLCAVLVALLLQASPTSQNPMSQNYSNELLRAAKAAHIMAYMNEKVQPCSDFFEFACGNWPKLHPASSSNGRSTFLQQLQELYVQKSAEMLKSDNRLYSSVETKLHDFYQSCRNAHITPKSDDAKTVLSAVGFKGGWPTIETVAWYEDEYDWLRTVADLRRDLGVNIMLGVDVIPDLEDINTHRILVGTPEFTLQTKDAYLSPDREDTREQYKQSIANKLHRLFPEQAVVWADEVAQQVLELEQQLANGMVRPDQSTLTLKQTSRLRSAAELRAAYGSYVDLSRYLNLVFNQTIYVQVYESPLEYMSTLVDVIRQTPKLTIANYTMWRVLEHVIFANEINVEPRDNPCVEKLMEYFSDALESLYYRNYNNVPLINELQSVWADIKNSFREQLQASTRLNWLSQDTRQKATIKLDAMELEFMSHDYDNFAQQMQLFHFSGHSYYANLMRVLQWQTQQHLAKLVEQPQPTKPHVQLLPRYEPNRNKVLIPITMLQARFFWDSSYPHALKYGTLGIILAQQMLHGFDDIGRRYDSHGYQRNWWDNFSDHAFTVRSSCFDKQYAQYTFEGRNVTGIMTEHSTGIADNGALSIAYQTYQKWWKFVADKELSALESLPMLDYSQNQLFFIGFAQLWCAAYTDRGAQQLLELPERVRVNGALANSVDFAREYKCSTGSLMNPELKCSVY